MKHLYKIAVVSLTFALLATLCSCVQNTDSVPPASISPSPDVITNAPGSSKTSSEASSSTSIVVPTNAAAMSAYKDVFLNNTTFFSTDNNESMTLNQSLSSFIDYLYPMTISRFAITDLDNDGIPEVVLLLNIGVEILHYQDGLIYGYDLVDRAFMELKTDGSFSFSSGSADNGFGTISFTNTGYKINEIAYSKSSIDSNGNVNVSYSINQKSATMDKFNTAFHQWENKPAATFYDFTQSNIETIFSEPVSSEPTSLNRRTTFKSSARY